MPGCVWFAGPRNPPPRIRKITIEHLNVYPPENGKTSVFPYSLVNSLHFVTKSYIIERELLFSENTVLDQALLEETERNLRSFRYFRKVAVTAEETQSGDYDVLVQTIDAWTTKLVFSLNRTGGELEGKIGVIEDNLLGQGKHLATYYSSEAERDSIHFYYKDPRLFGRFISSQMTYSSSADLDRVKLKLVKPFTSSLSRWACVFYGERENGRRFLYENGKESSRFLQDHKIFGFFVAKALDVSTSRILRYGAGFRFTDDSFKIGRGRMERQPLFMDRTYSTFYGAFEYKKIDFVKEYNLNTYGRDEDFNLGTRFLFELGCAPTILGSTADALFVDGSIKQGFAFDEGHIILGSIHLSGRLQNELFQNILGKGELHHFYRIYERLTLWNHAEVTLLHEADPEKQYVLGGEEGLQGYALNYFTGNKGVLFNSEARFLLCDDVLKIFTIGGVLFFDAGKAWPEEEPMNLSELQADAGLGLRITFPRSSSGGVIKIIYSYAFGANGMDNRWLFSFSTTKPYR